METEIIEIPVDREAAEAYRNASEEERQKAQEVISSWLKGGGKERPVRPLTEVMRDMSREARERGLTPEILDEILSEK